MKKIVGGMLAFLILVSGCSNGQTREERNQTEINELNKQAQVEQTNAIISNLSSENAAIYKALTEKGWTIEISHQKYKITNDAGTDEGTEANIFIKNEKRSFYIYSKKFNSFYFSYSVPRTGRIDVYDMKDDEQKLARITYFDSLYHFSYKAREPFSQLYPTQFEGTLNWVPQQDFPQEIIDEMNTLYSECLADLDSMGFQSPEQMFLFTNDLSQAEYEATKI